MTTHGEWLKDAPRCAAKTTKGQPCRAPAIRGLTVCRVHGGATKRARAAAAVRVAAGIDPRAPKVKDIPLRPSLDVESATLEQLAELLRLTTFVCDRVESFTAADFTVNDSEVGIRIAPMVELMRGLLGDSSRWTQSAMKLRLEDRRIRVEEERVRWIVDVLVAAIDQTPINTEIRAGLVERVAAGLTAGRAPLTNPAGLDVCGTEAGRARHRARGETVCADCAAGYSLAQSARAQAKRDAFRRG